MKFQRKPQVIEAVQYTHPASREFLDFVGDSFVEECNDRTTLNTWVAVLKVAGNPQATWCLPEGHWIAERECGGFQFAIPDYKMQAEYQVLTSKNNSL